jgi:hypothetical protein
LAHDSAGQVSLLDLTDLKNNQSISKAKQAIQTGRRQAF